MTLYDYVYGYFLIKAMIAGAEAMEDTSDEYYTGMRDAYAALEKALREYEEGLSRAKLNSEKGGLNA